MSVPTPLKQTHLTALALVPPLHIQALLLPTRNIHDRSSSRYPAHITLPFVEPSNIGATVTELRKTFSAQPLTSFNLEFESTPGVFRGRKECVIHLLPTTESTRNIRELWLRISRAVDPNYREDARRPFAPHLTLGQAPHDAVAILRLEDGAKRILETLAAIQTEDGWTISSFVVLRKDLADGGAMKPYASVPLDGRGDQEISRTLSTATWPMYMWDSVVNAWTLATAVAPSIDSFPRGQYQPLSIVIINSNHLLLEKPPIGLSDDADILVIDNLTDHILTSILAHPDIIHAFPHSSRSPQMSIGLSPGPLIISRTPISVRRVGSNFVIDVGARGRMAVPFATSAEESDTELMELLQTPGLRLILDGAKHARTGSGLTGWRGDGGHLVAHGSRLDRPRQSGSSVAADVLLVLNDKSPETEPTASRLDADFLAALPSFSSTSSVSPSSLASAALNSLESLFRTERPSMDASPSEKGPVKIGFAVVGAAAFGLEDDDDLVEISAIGNISPKAFRGLLLERLGVDVSQEDENIKVKFDVSKVRRAGETTRYGDAILTMPVVDGAAGLNRDARVKVWYTMNAELVERRWTGSYVAEASSVRAGHTQQPLPALPKLAVVTKLCDDAPLLRSFQLSYSAISMLARAKSGWSARYGYLSSGLLFDVLAATAEDTSTTAIFISKALSRLASSSPSPYSPAATYQSVFVRRIASEIRKALGGSASLASLMAARHGDPFRSFIQDAERDGATLIRVDASYWGAGSAGKQEAIMAKIEEQLIATMEVQNELDGLSYSGESATKFFHLYPARLRETPAQDEDNNGTVSWLFLAVGSLDDIESFLELLMNSASDAGEDCFIEMNIVGAAEVDRLVSVLQPSAQTSANSTLVASGVSASSSAAISPAPMITSSVNYHQTEPATTTKLRPAPDIYHRLLWTPPQPTTSGDYVIGYEDRFDGVREMRLGGWRKDVEDEAFIPFHRVVYFKRATDGLVVWDRAKKFDLIFGSGLLS